jgi:hypothetical protein
MDKNEKRGETYLMKNLWRRKIKSFKKRTLPVDRLKRVNKFIQIQKFKILDIEFLNLNEFIDPF